MSIKVLGGHAKGFKVEVPNSQNVRPTSVMLRRKVFDAFQDLRGFHFHDICAGSGAMGFEASSRGAKTVSFYESDKKAHLVLSKNVDNFLKLPSNESEFFVFKREFQKSLQPLEIINESILFFDPPYQKKLFYGELAQLLSQVNASHQIWIESDRQKGLKEEEIQAIFGKSSKVFTQGTSFIFIINNFFSSE